MIDLVSLSIPLGRWFGISVRLHWFFVIYLGTVIVRSLFQSTPIGRGLLEAGAICILLVLAVATRELTQLTLLPRLGLSRVDVRLWPLGNLVVAGSVLAKRSVESAFIAATTLVTGLSLTLAAGLGLAMSGAWLELNPFGGAQGGSPMLSTGQPAAAFTPLWWIGWFGYWNWVLFLANLIPALPFEMGRIVRGCVRTSHRETEVFPYLARGIAILSALVGATRLYSGKPGGVELLCIALLIEWLVRLESRQLEESGYLDEGAFGYDFSQGYTSLEVGPSVVRPQRLGALQRWRQRRSELRRRRRLDQEAAEGARLDEILEKLHRQGRGSLAVEEYRFLERVSSKLRHRQPREL